MLILIHFLVWVTMVTFGAVQRNILIVGIGASGLLLNGGVRMLVFLSVTVNKENVMLETEKWLSWYGFRFEEKKNDTWGYSATNPTDTNDNALLSPQYHFNTAHVSGWSNFYWNGGSQGIYWGATAANVEAAYYELDSTNTLFTSTIDQRLQGTSLRYPQTHIKSISRA